MLGHGVQANDQNYLIPVEEVENDALLDYKALRVSHVLERVHSRGCHLNLVVLDACRSKPPTMRGGSRSLGRGLAKIEAKAGSVVAFACEPGETASDGNGRNGAFTEQLLRNLGRPGVDVDFMLGDVAAAVEQGTNGAQKPFRNHNLQGKRPCCLLEGTNTAAPESAAPVAPAPPSAVEASLAAFLSACKLDAEQQTEVSTALRVIGVKSAAHLYAMEEEDLRDCKLPPVTLRLLQAGLRTMKDDSRMKEAASAATSAASSIVDSIANHSKNNNLEAVVAAMRAHSSNAGVQEAGCGALRNMTANDGNKVKAGGAGAIEAVVAAMRAHSSNACVRQYGRLALDRLQLPSKSSTTPNPVPTPRTTDASGGCCTLQ